MIKKNIFIGIVIGLIANTIGFIMAVFIFGHGDNIENVVKESIAQGFFGKLVSIGAILNLITFFLLLKLKRDYRARGVILATVLIAIATFLINFT